MKECMRKCGCVSWALVVAGVIFGIVCLVHLYRIFHFFPIIFGTVALSEGFSYVGFIVAGLLSFWMFKSAHCCCKCCSVCTHDKVDKVVVVDEDKK